MILWFVLRLFVLYNLGITSIEAVWEGSGHSLISSCSLSRSSELLSASQSEWDDEDDLDGLWWALNLGRCSGRGLSCAALISAPEAPHRVHLALLTSEESHLAGTWGNQLYLQHGPDVTEVEENERVSHHCLDVSSSLVALF